VILPTAHCRGLDTDHRGGLTHIFSDKASVRPGNFSIGRKKTQFY